MKTLLPIVEMTDEQLREWLFRGQRKPALFLVRKPAPKPEQLTLDFDREIERVMSDILERTQRKPKVG
jgi:hypothetical protein